MVSVEKANITNGTRVFVRCDIDVLVENEKISETFRLDVLLETLNFIIQKSGKPIIAGHIGRPEGKVVKELSTQYLLPYFNEKLGEGKFELLENLRFDPREETNDETFAKELASKADIYVNESFATCHREHASIVGVPKLLSSYAGFRLQKETNTLNKVLQNPEKPLVVIIGGAKIESKAPVISRFLEIADHVLLGGKIGQEWKKNIPVNLILPTDYAPESKDIGKETIAKFAEIIRNAKTVLWVGPLGMYEDERFINGTSKVALVITENPRIFSVVGGGDTITALNNLGHLQKFSFVSTGGGAMLEFLAKGTLVGIEALNKND